MLSSSPLPSAAGGQSSAEADNGEVGSSRPTKMTEALLQSTGGYELVFSAMILGFLGYGLDRVFGTKPWLVVIFSILGFLGASASLYYRYKFQVRLLDHTSPAQSIAGTAPDKTLGEDR